MDKEILTSSGRKIYVLEDLFDYATRSHMYKFTVQSLFNIAGSDNGLLEAKEHVSLVSVYGTYDVERLKILEGIPENIKNDLNITMDRLRHAMVNLSTPADRFHTHVDNNSENSITLVYYLNMEWHPEWGGDTVFLDDTGTNFEYVSQYKPGKLLLFDSRIPHLIRPSTILSPHFRLTFAAKFFS